MMLGILIGLGVSALALLAYWLIHITEGALLGPRVITLLYDRSASHYDAIKGFHSIEEAWFLARPLLHRLAAVPQPLILDVATGTGRLPYALFREAHFLGRIIALDLSRPMLEEAVPKTEDHDDRILFLHQDATRLPFPDATFDAVTCLEALEFLPDARQTLQEVVRVLRPGGVLLTTNRRGWEARLFLGRALTRSQIVSLLRGMGLQGVTVQSWQHIYDLVWARKPGDLLWATWVPDYPQPALPTLIRCPQCQRALLQPEATYLRCPHCGTAYSVEGSIVELTKPRPAVPIT